MDCDALYHLHGIRVVNVHDTSCCHFTATGQESVCLNDVLFYNGVAENGTRDCSVYKTNPAFWATRPLSNQMINWSSSDVDKLLIVASKQKSKLEGQGRYTQALAKSSLFITIIRDMKLECGLVCRVSIGAFIDTRGRNIRDLQARTGTNIYEERKNSGRKSWRVYYNDLDSLNSVKRAMGYTT